MNISTQVIDGVPVVAVNGDVDVASAYDMYLEVAAAAEEGYNRVVIDLGAVTFMDSTGLGMLIRCNQDLRTMFESSLTLRAPSAPVMTLLDITAMTGDFVIDMKAST